MKWFHNKQLVYFHYAVKYSTASKSGTLMHHPAAQKHIYHVCLNADTTLSSLQCIQPLAIPRITVWGYRNIFRHIHHVAATRYTRCLPPYAVHNLHLTHIITVHTMCWSLRRWMTRDDHSDIDTESGALRISRNRQRAALCFTASSVSLTTTTRTNLKRN